MSPEELQDALNIADLMDGELPHWQRQDGIGDGMVDDSGERLMHLEASKLKIHGPVDTDDEPRET